MHQSERAFRAHAKGQQVRRRAGLTGSCCRGAGHDEGGKDGSKGLPGQNFSKGLLSLFTRHGVHRVRATRRVAAAADPALEHARLALALGVAPPVAALKPTRPPAAGTGGGISEGELKKLVERQVAAAVAGRPPPGGEPSKRQQKAAERQNRGRLPEGQRCKAGTCDLAHDTKYPGKPCYSDPRVAIEVEFDTRHPDGVRPGYLARLTERRAVEGKRPTALAFAPAA